MDEHLEKPLVTVFMAVYNGEHFIAASIASVLNQSFEGFELLIIDDGSTDATAEVVHSFSDARIRFLSNGANRGLCYTRNKGVAEARGKYLAVLDSDDLALADRLRLQLAYMEANPDVAVCGGQALMIDRDGKDIGRYPPMPVGREHMGMHVLFRNIFINPACMLRIAVIKELGGYRDYAPAEDYDLYVRIALKYQMAILPDDLVKYRIHEANASKTKFGTVRLQEKRILGMIHERLGISSEQLLEVHHRLYLEDLDNTSSESMYSLLARLVEGNRKTSLYPTVAFERFVFLKGLSLLRLGPKRHDALCFYFKRGVFRWRYFKATDLMLVLRSSLSGIWRQIKKRRSEI